MPIRKIYAHLSCSDLGESIDWFTRLFGRAPDSRPMAGLAEWHHHANAGFQLFENSKDAGHSTLTLIVDGLRYEYERLAGAGLNPGEIEAADTVSLIRLRDPDDNLIVFASPKQP
jgi:catechol 2,3-dioxygenase-like lactoylglutathione lyase family enzyme